MSGDTPPLNLKQAGNSEASLLTAELSENAADIAEIAQDLMAKDRKPCSHQQTIDRTSGIVSYSTVVSTNPSPLVMVSTTPRHSTLGDETSSMTESGDLAIMSPKSQSSGAGEGPMGFTKLPSVASVELAAPDTVTTIVQTSTSAKDLMARKLDNSPPSTRAAINQSLRSLPTKSISDTAFPVMSRRSADEDMDVEAAKIGISPSITSFATARSNEQPVKKAASYEGFMHAPDQAEGASDEIRRREIVKPDIQAAVSEPELLIDTTSLARQLASPSNKPLEPRQKSGSQLSDLLSPFSQTSTEFQPHSHAIRFASVRRNQEFHAMFRSVPEDDPLIEDYSCALQKEILVQGRIYITKNHVCFNSNIFGWVTNLVISLTDILSIERRMTAYVIPNAIHLTTLHAKYLFTSFMYREQAYVAMVRLWRRAMGDDVDGLPFGDATQAQRKLSDFSGGGIPTGVDMFSDDGLMDLDAFSNEEQVAESEESGVVSPRSMRVYSSSAPQSQSPLMSAIKGHEKQQQSTSTRRPLTPGRPPMMPPSKTSDTATIQRLAVTPEKKGSGSLSDGGLITASNKEKRKWQTRFLNDIIKSRSNSTSSKNAEADDETGGYEQDDEDLVSDSPRKKKPFTKVRPGSRASARSSRAEKKRLSTKLKVSEHTQLKPSHIEEIRCDCIDHRNTILVDRVFPLSISSLATIMYGSGWFAERVLQARGMEDVEVSNWEINECAESKKEHSREISYAYPLNFSILKQAVRIHSKQSYVRRQANKVVCVRETTSVTKLLRIVTTQCLTRVSDHETKLLVTWDVQFSRAVAPIVKRLVELGFVENNRVYWKLYEQMLANDCRSFTQQVVYEEKPLPKKTPKRPVLVDVKEYWLSLKEALLPLFQYICALLLVLNILFLLRVWSLESRLDKFSNSFSSKPQPTGLEHLPHWWFEGKIYSDQETAQLTKDLPELIQKYESSSGSLERLQSYLQEVGERVEKAEKNINAMINEFLAQ